MTNLLDISKKAVDDKAQQERDDAERFQKAFKQTIENRLKSIFWGKPVEDTFIPTNSWRSVKTTVSEHITAEFTLQKTASALVSALLGANNKIKTLEELPDAFLVYTWHCKRCGYYEISPQVLSSAEYFHHEFSNVLKAECFTKSKTGQRTRHERGAGIIRPWTDEQKAKAEESGG
jgi:hypothetical protein